jgi:hypothetical protein
MRTRFGGVISLSGEFTLFSFVVGFGVATLLATAILFVMQMAEDFRDA